MAIFSNLGFRARSAWNAFFNKDPTPFADYGSTYSYRQFRPYSYRKDKSIVPAVLTRFSVDAAAVDIKHVLFDEEERLKKVINSSLNDCLTLEANVDQTGRSFIQDAVYSMLDEALLHWFRLIQMGTLFRAIHMTFSPFVQVRYFNGIRYMSVFKYTTSVAESRKNSSCQRKWWLLSRIRFIR